MSKVITEEVLRKIIHDVIYEALTERGTNMKYSKNVRELLTSTMEKNLSDIESHNGNFFAYQTKSLKKELEEIAPYKYRKYISPIDEMARKQIAEYEKKFGKRISIFQIKTNLANKYAA